MALVAKGSKLTIRAVQGARFFLLVTIYDERRTNFLKNATFVAKLILSLDFDEKSIYEFRLKNETVNMKIFRIKGRGLYFDQFRFFCRKRPIIIQKNHRTSKK